MCRQEPWQNVAFGHAQLGNGLKFTNETLARKTHLEIQLCRTSFILNMSALHRTVPSLVQTCILFATQEVHIFLFTFSVYCLHSSGRQRCYFSVDDPWKAPSLHSVFDPSTCCSTTEIMRDCEEKLAVPVEALGEKSKQQFPLSPLPDAVLGCVHVILTLLTISWLRGEISTGYEKEGATK